LSPIENDNDNVHIRQWCFKTLACEYVGDWPPPAPTDESLADNDPTGDGEWGTDDGRLRGKAIPPGGGDWGCWDIDGREGPDEGPKNTKFLNVTFTLS